MASLPTILAVDPTSSIPQQIRAAFDLMDREKVQIDVPGPEEAVDWVKRGGIDIVVASWNLDGLQGWELAAQLRQVDENVKILLFGDYNDTELDEEMIEQSPFVYLRRPLDIPQLINVLKAALDGGDIFAAVNQQIESSAGAKVDFGPVPDINQEKAAAAMQEVMYDMNPIAAFVANRDGEIVASSRIDSGDVDYEYVSRLIGNSAEMNINMRDVIGGNLQTLQLYDGSDYDIFILSVGLHHSLALVFDGKDGASKIGSVRNYGTKRAEDLIAAIGPPAFMVQRTKPTSEPQEVRRKSERTKKTTQETPTPELARASLGTGSVEEDEPATVGAEMPQLEAIAADDFSLDDLFGDNFDEGSADDLFSLDALEGLEIDDGKKGTLDWGDAVQLGLLDDQ